MHYYTRLIILNRNLWAFLQRSILAVKLFSIKIHVNSLAEVLRDGMQGSVYVNDFVIYYKSKIMNSFEKQLQLCLLKIKSVPIRMALHFQKLKLLASIFVPNINLIIILAYI